MNIVLVIFDSLRKDCIGAYGQPPWGKVHTPNFDSFAEESVVFTRAYPESLPTLPARRAMYTGRRCYPFHGGNVWPKGDNVKAPGWNPIPEEHATLADTFQEAGRRTALISDLYHEFKPGKNFWRGFDQWTFLRGQEMDPSRSGPEISQEVLDHWLPKEHQSNERSVQRIQREIRNMHDRWREEDYFSPRVLRGATQWLEQNTDADSFFLTVESFDPHEPWIIPPHYRKMYLDEDDREQIITGHKVDELDPALARRTRANYSGSVTQCDRWFGYFMEQMRLLGRLDDTMVILTSDHGHSLGDVDYFGKRGYPSYPEVIDIPLMIRLPGAEHAGTHSDMLVQHHDIAAEIFLRGEAQTPEGIDGRPFLDAARAGEPGTRNHVTIGWSTAVTVIKDHWWLNCRIDGAEPLLRDLSADAPFASNVAETHPDIVSSLFQLALDDAPGGFPDWLMEMLENG